VRDRREFTTTLGKAREKGQSIFNLRVKITKIVYFVFAAPLVGCCFWMNGIQEKVFLRKKRGTTKGGKISRQLTVEFFFSQAMRDFRSTNSSSSIKKEKKKKTRLSQVQGSAMFDSDG